MTDAPNIQAMSPEQASSHLAALESNSDFGKLLSSRDLAAYATLKALSHRINGVPLDAPVASPITLLPVDTASTGGPTMARSEHLEQIEQMRQRGYTDGEIADTFRDDREFAPEFVATVKAEWSVLESSEQFRKALVAGDFEARRQLRAYSWVMSGNVKRAA